MIHSVIKRDQVHVTATRAERPATTTTAEAKSRHAKRAELVRIDGVVRALEITCTCGETTVVELEYSNTKEGA